MQLSDLLHATNNFKVFDIDKKRIVRDDEYLNLKTNYGIAFTINNLFMNDFLRIGQRTDHQTN